jgi:hypothetical protein
MSASTAHLFSPVTGVQLGGSLAGKLASDVSSTTSRFFPRGLVSATDDFFGTTFRAGAGFFLAAITSSVQPRTKYV